MSKCGKSAVITKLESCHLYCANFKKNLVFCCLPIYLPDLKLSNDPKVGLFHSVHETAASKWPGTQGGQVPDYVQYAYISKYTNFHAFPWHIEQYSSVFTTEKQVQHLANRESHRCLFSLLTLVQHHHSKSLQNSEGTQYQR
jgi:hypothetical protein